LNRFNALLAVAAALAIACAGAAADAGQAPKVRPLRHLAHDCQKGAEKQRQAALEQLLTRKDVWAYDLLYRYGPKDQRFSEKHAPALALAILQGHYAGTKQAMALFKIAWGRAAATSEEKLGMLMFLRKRAQTRHSGLKGVTLSVAGQKLLASVLSPKDLREFDDLLPDVAKGMEPLGDSPEKQELDRLAKLIRNGTDPADEKVCDGIIGLKAAAAEKAAVAEILDRLFVEWGAKLGRTVNANGWEKTLDKTPGVVKCFGVCPAISRHAKKKMPRSSACAEDLALQALSQLGTKLDFASLFDPKNTDRKKQFLRFMAVYAMCKSVSSASHQDWRRDKKLTISVEYEKLPAPFNFFVADIAAREGDSKAGEYLQRQLVAAVEAAEKIENRRTLATNSRKTAEAQAASRDLDNALWVLGMALEMSSADRTGLEKVSQRLRKLAAPSGGTGAFSIRTALARLQRDTRPPETIRAAKIARIKKDYAEKRIDLGRYLIRMDDLDALDDADLFRAYKTDIKGIATVSNHIAACKLIGLRGGPDDSILLNSFYMERRRDIVEAMIAAAESRGYVELPRLLIKLYPREKMVWRRRLIARLAANVGTVKELDFFETLLDHEKDEACLASLAQGIYRLCHDPRGGEDICLRIGARLKSEHYGQRWFYLASVLRALVPDMSLTLDPDTRKNIVERNREIDRAVREAIKRLKAKKAAS